MHFMTDIKKLLGFVENTLDKELSSSIYSHKEHLSPYRVCEEFQGTIYCNSDPVQPSDTDLPLYSCVALADS